MKKSLSESKQELQDAILRLREMIATNLQNVSINEIRSICEPMPEICDCCYSYHFSESEFKKQRDSSIGLLKQIHEALSKEPIADLQEILEKLEEVSSKLPESYVYYKGYSVIFYPLIPLNNLCRAFLRLLDVLINGENTLHKTGKTPLAKEILGTNQFFALSPKDEIKAATKQFNETRLAFEMAMSMSNNAVIELTVASAINSSSAPISFNYR